MARNGHLVGRHALLGAIVISGICLAAACDTSQPEPLSAETTATTAEAVQTPTCLTIERGGVGNIADATISHQTPNTAAGSSTVLQLSGASSAEQRTLFQFDLSAVPAGATIVKGVLTLQKSGSASGPIHAYLPLSPWTEATVTWNNFGGFAPGTVEGSVIYASTTAGVDLKAQVQSWVNGAPNDGILLAEAAPYHSSFKSSEDVLAARPQLQVCYTTVDLCANVTCETANQCQTAPGSCNPSTGLCVYPQLPDGTSCTSSVSCDAATCQGGLCTCGGGFGNTWYFGFNAGLDFTTSPPTPLLDGALSTWEGCTTASDVHGNLLFYTDGQTVWNNHHQVMSNGTGLFGSNSATQSATFVPKPGTTNLFYVFTEGAVEINQYGLHVSTVDTTGAGGLGAITDKNTQLMPSPGSEINTTVRNTNGVDYWVLSMTYNADFVYAFPVTAAGVGTPVMSPVATNGENYFGAMKPNRAGTQLSRNGAFDGLWLYDFDASTGAASNGRYIDTPCTGGYGYGSEFSGNGNILYASCYSSPAVYQYDLTAGSAAAIAATQTFLGNGSAPNGGQLQHGPDGRIYHGNSGGPYIGGDSHLNVINFPDVLGAGCDYVPGAVDLGGRLAGLGLPSVLHGTF